MTHHHTKHIHHLESRGLENQGSSGKSVATLFLHSVPITVYCIMVTQNQHCDCHSKELASCSAVPVRGAAHSLQMLEKLVALDYPKSHISLWVHNKVISSYTTLFYTCSD